MPELAGVAPNWANSKQKWPRSPQIGRALGRHSVKFDQHRPNWQILFEVGQLWAKFGQIWANFGPFGQDSNQAWPKLANPYQFLAMFGQLLNNLGRALTALQNESRSGRRRCLRASLPTHRRSWSRCGASCGTPRSGSGRRRSTTSRESGRASTAVGEPGRPPERARP